MWKWNDGTDYLMHHGIKGQKWGIRNGPPYPLPYKVHKRVLAKQKTDSRTYGTVTSFGGHLTDSRDQRFIEVQERVFPDGRVIYPPIAKVIEDFERDLGTNPYPKEKSFNGVYDKVNPDFGQPGTTNNCTFCGVAVELEGRGYDVVARRSFGGASANAFTKWFNGAQNELCQSFQELHDDIIDYGDGSSGVLQGYYGNGLGSGMGGHTLHWRNENGNIIVADGQSHTEMPFKDIVDTYHFNPGQCINTRLDNCEPNWQQLAEDGAIGTRENSRRWKDKYAGTVYDGW